MLPTTPTLATTRLFAEDTVQPVCSAAQIADVLSEFAPGQKLLAQVQAQLANGAYRATIAQRDVTLALPFAAKAGDALELEVVETDGRVAFAVVPPRTAKPEQDSSASASISRTGMLISSLLASPTEEIDERSTGVLLSKGEPISERPPTKAADLAPMLQNAVGKSGLFYESHQAKWVASAQPMDALLDEPQIMLAAPSRPTEPSSPLKAESATKEGPKTTAGLSAPPISATKADDEGRAGHPVQNQRTSLAANADTALVATARRTIPDEIVPLVQQQLNALASNVYAFHGLAWPGQRIEWEIVDQDGQRNSASDDDAPVPWKTRLHLALPSLGSIDASLQLNGNTLAVHLTAPDSEAARALRNAAPQLQQRLADTGLQLFALQVEEQEIDGETESPAA
jgi:hypothetical protein